MLGAFLGLILAVIAIVLIVLFKVRASLGGAKFKEVIRAAKNAAKNHSVSEFAQDTRQKDVVGMTRVLEPTILRDFPEFNKDLLYSKTEKNLRTIFNAIESKNIAPVARDEDLLYIVPIVQEKIKDLNSSGTDVKYDDIKFHRHAIKKYDKSKGIASVEVSSTVEYYYMEKSNKKKKISKDYEEFKKQTRYTSTFVYVYDESKLSGNEAVFGLHCPNCGAPIRKLDQGSCEYCTSHLEPINLKIWKMSSYKEDYK